MALVSDQHILNLLGISDRLYRRITQWFDGTDLTDDLALKIPDQRVRECIGQIHKIVTDVARLDMDRAKYALAARTKGGQQLTDEQYQAEIAKFRNEILNEMSSSDLAMEIDRRERMS